MVGSRYTGTDPESARGAVAVAIMQAEAYYNHLTINPERKGQIRLSLERRNPSSKNSSKKLRIVGGGRGYIGVLTAVHCQGLIM